MKTTMTMEGCDGCVASGAESEPAERAVLAGLSMTMLLSSLGTSIANVGLPTLAAKFGATFQQVQWVVLAYLLAITTLIVGVGRLGDLTGRRRLMLAGVGAFTVASALCGVTPTLGGLIAARAVQGLGAAIMMALTLALVGETVPKARIGRAMGWLATMSALGTALGPSLGGTLIAGFGWRALFFVNVPLGVVAFYLVQRALPKDRASAGAGRARFDAAGTLVLAVALGAYALAMTLGRGGFGGFNAWLLVVAAGALGIFAMVERRAMSPLIRLAMVRDRALRANLAMSGLVATVLMATLVVGPFYLSRSLGLAPASVGVVLSVGPLVVALTGVPAGRMIDRFGARRMTLAGLAGIAAGCVMLTWIQVAHGIAGYVAAIAILTVGYGLFQSANNTAVMANVGAEQRGVVSGLLNLARNLGLITGASAMGAVFAAAAGSGDLAVAQPGAVAAGMRMTFVVGAALSGLALAMAMAPVAAADGERTTQDAAVGGRRVV